MQSHIEDFADMMTLLEQFGANVRARREAVGITQEDLAELSGLHRTYIGSIERGERNLSLINIFKLAAALNCQGSDLLRNIKMEDLLGQ